MPLVKFMQDKDKIQQRRKFEPANDSLFYDLQQNTKNELCVVPRGKWA